MPLELSNPEGWFPYHYDTRYEHVRPGQPDLGTPGLDDYLQSMSSEVVGRTLSPDELFRLKMHLEQKGLLFQNKGDETFRNEATRFLKKLNMAKRVAKRCQI